MVFVCVFVLVGLMGDLGLVVLFEFVYGCFVFVICYLCLMFWVWFG